MKDNKVTLNVYVVPEMKEYLAKQSEVYGMSISSFVAMVITTYRQQSDALAQLSKLQETITKLSELKEVSNDK